MQHSTTIGILALALAAGTASAQWSDNFDGYSNGTVLYGVGGWSGWDGDQTAAGTVSDAQSSSAPHSIAVGNGGSDAVRPVSGYTSGQWTFSCNVYVPSDLDGITYFLLLNDYADFGPYDWAVEIDMDPAAGTAKSVFRDPNGDTAAPLVYDQWVPIRVDFDLDNNTGDVYYNGALIGAGTWDAYSGSGILEFETVDLYAPHGATVYYDDLVLAPAGDPCLDGYANCNGDGAVNTQDFLCYLGLWSSGNLAADCNGDNTVNTQDFLCYLGLWSACQ
jgi:hypothetical protein